MELTVLGADGTFPSPGGACSGYLLREDGFTLWMDAGTGTLANLQKHVAIEDVDAIFLSHVHPDHCVDLYPFFYSLVFHPEGTRRVPVFAPKGALEVMKALAGSWGGERFPKVFDWREQAPGDDFGAGPFTMRAYDAAHSAPNLTVRIGSGGKVFCYSGDTGPHDDLPIAAKDADFFLCEASWQDSDAETDPIHLRAREAGRIARGAGAGRLAITHVWARHDLAVSRAQAEEEFGGTVDIAARAGGWTI